MSKQFLADCFVFFSMVAIKCVRTDQNGLCPRYYMGCCPDTRWDFKEEQCVECANGFFGLNCSRSCPFPLYGNKCLQTCSCEEVMCDFMNGCKNGERCGPLCHKIDVYVTILVVSGVILIGGLMVHVSVKPPF